MPLLDSSASPSSISLFKSRRSPPPCKRRRHAPASPPPPARSSFGPAASAPLRPASSHSHGRQAPSTRPDVRGGRMAGRRQFRNLAGLVAGQPLFFACSIREPRPASTMGARLLAGCLPAGCGGRYRPKENGGKGRNRTDDTRIFSPLLYQLSYLATQLHCFGKKRRNHTGSRATRQSRPASTHPILINLWLLAHWRSASSSGRAVD